MSHSVVELGRAVQQCFLFPSKKFAHPGTSIAPSKDLHPTICEPASGMKKSNKCPFVQVGPKIKAVQNSYTAEINVEVNCQTKTLIYIVGCRKCNEQYVGETSRTLQERFSEHLGYVKNKQLNKGTGAHFNLKGHNQSDMNISILEKEHNLSDQFRKQREKLFIAKFNTKHKGMHRKT